MEIIIIAAGTKPSKELLNKRISSESIIIASDGGANCLFEYKIIPHYLIGDFDSISEDAMGYFQKTNTVIKQYPRSKNKTDTQLALEKAFSLSANKIILLGCIGGERVDHMLGALGLLLTCYQAGISVSLEDDLQTVTIINSPTTLNGSPGNIFSLQAYSETVTNLNIVGSKYELKNYNLRVGDALTISNEFIGRPVIIDFTSGNLLLNLML